MLPGCVWKRRRVVLSGIKGKGKGHANHPLKTSPIRHSLPRDLRDGNNHDLIRERSNGTSGRRRLDPTFGTGGMVTTDINIAPTSPTRWPSRLMANWSSSGKPINTTIISDEDFVVTRYNTDGTLDNSFGIRGRVRTDFPGLAAVPSSVVIQPDGKIVVAGGPFRSSLFSAISKWSAITRTDRSILPLGTAAS